MPMIGLVKPIRINVGDFKNKTLSPFKTNTLKQTVYEKSQKLSKLKVTLKPITLITLEILL